VQGYNFAPVKNTSHKKINKMKMIRKIGWKKILLAGAAKLVVSVLIIACTKTTATVTDNSNVTTAPIFKDTNATNTESTQIVYLPNPTGGAQLKAVLYIPSSSVPVPAVVVLHGSSGLWSSTDSTNTKMSLQFKGWIDSFRVHKIAALFVDSYTARGVKTFHNMTPPYNFPIAAEFVRPRDAYAGLEFLRANNKIIPGKIALLGFSHGATTVLSTMVDAAAVAKNTAWSEISGSTTYTNNVLAPASKPAAGGFVAAVSYYPGAAMFSYYGKPGTPSDGKYVNYAPIMMHAAGTDPLYTTTYTNTDNNTQISAYDALILKSKLNPASAAISKFEYADAAHSFDGEKLAGADATASVLARTRTIAFLKYYLFN